MRNRATIVLLIIIGLLLLRFVYGYLSSYHYSLDKRAKLAARKHPDIHIAVVWDKNDNSFMKGVLMAVNEINLQGISLKADDKTIKARFVLHEYDDSTEESSKQARLNIAGDQRIVAVLGHSTSVSAIPASITYEYNGILFISVVATLPTLTNHNFKYTFSTIPSEFFFANQLVQFALKRNWYRLVVLHARNPYGLGFYETFASQLEPPMQLVSVKSYFPDQNKYNDYKELVYTIMKYDFDAVILGDAEQNAAEMIKQLRHMGMNKPILGGDGLDNLRIWEWSGNTANQVYVASTLQGENSPDSKETALFESNYVIQQGYEAMHILADAIQKTGSSEPILVASTLKFNYRQGYSGYMFDTNGLITNKHLYVKEYRNGKFIMAE
ncbi:MAG: ABC transporter substrate-binding protein [Methylomonas sp.]|nr:ABC transporter substrate-binding protein [Methylomonas sp.]